MVTRFGAYEILYELKSGGMGSVLLGRRRGPGRFEQLVAIKTILPVHAQSEVVRAMFLDEAALLARLSHPAIATVHDFGEDHGTLYMVMEYVEGISFRDAAAHGLPATVAARAIAEACRGVHAAHEVRDLAGGSLGVVHRDISPDNLMFGFDGHVKVIDFGIALIKNRQAPVTELGTVKGKPPYMSPEQIKNEPIDRRSDVFSLAVVLWELLTGAGLFDGDSIYAVARAVAHQDIRPPSQALGAALPLGLDAAVMNALDRDVAHRTPTAAAFAEQLEEVIQTAGGETLEAWAARALDEPRREHRTWLAGVVAGRDAPRPIGRPTGSVTAIAPAGKAPTVIAPVVPASPPPAEVPREPAPEVSTHLAVDTDDHALPRRNLGLPILLAALVLAMVGGAVYLTRGGGPPGRDAGIVVISDATVDALASGDASIVLVEQVDAAIEPIAPVDAALDAGHRRRVTPVLDGGRTVARDAAPIDPPRPPPRDAPAAAEPAVQGFGKLTAKHTRDRYLNVVLDGRMIGPTPMFRMRIPAGPHVIELVDPTSSDIVVRRSVTVAPDTELVVVEP